MSSPLQRALRKIDVDDAAERAIDAISGGIETRRTRALDEIDAALIDLNDVVRVAMNVRLEISRALEGVRNEGK